MQRSVSPVQHSPDSTEPSSKKRKSTSSAFRGVASLTPEQLAKKRANDREAQRAIRERTKATIEGLERQIQELTSQQPYVELQTERRQKDALQGELDEIKRRLNAIQTLIQPILGAQGLTELAGAAQQNLRHAFPPSFSQDQLHAQDSSQILSDQSPNPASTASPDAVSQYSHQYTNGDGLTNNEKLWQTSRHTIDQQRTSLHRALELNESERLSFNFLLDAHKRPPPLHRASGHESPPQQNTTSPLGGAYRGPAQSSWTTLPNHIPPTCPLDGILLKFLHSRQQEARNTQHSLPSGPAYPSVSSLLNPTASLQVDPLSQLMTDIISKFPAICSLPEQVAVLYGMFLVMRWMIYPSQANYERIPDWLTPRPSQLFTPHPVWIDYLPWPRLRDKLVYHHQDYPFENWFIPFTTGLSINWPYEPTDCLISTSDSDEPVINPVFERHLVRLENWSVNPSFVHAFPGLAETVKVRQDVGSRSVEP